MDLNRAPYYDDYDPSKRYNKVLAVPGYNIQAREITQLQSALQYNMRNLSTAIFHEGNIVSGMAYIVNPVEETVTITRGRVYLEGIVHDFEEQTVDVPKTGRHTLGVRLHEEIVTSDQDSSLRDPALGSINYKQPGAHRLKQTPVLVVDDPVCPVIYTLVDSVVVIDSMKPQADTLQEVLAKRLYDQSGNYKVSGLDLIPGKLTSDPTNLELIVESGTAYVMGYEVTKPSPTRILVNRALDTQSVIGEIKVIQEGLDQYVLNNNWLNSVSRVLGVVETKDSMSKGVGGGSDRLKKTPVVKVLWVSSSASGDSPYQLNVDYTIRGDYIDWSPSGNEPGEGATYYVCYQYSKVLEFGKDYSINTGSNSYITLLSSGDRPVNSTTITIDYDFFLFRKDRVYLDKDGNLTVVPGQPNMENLCFAPPDTNPSQLSLGTISLMPESSTCSVSSGSIMRSSMKDISEFIRRMDDMAYNQAIQDLDKEAMEGESATELKGVFTDGFIGFSKCDLSNELYDGTIDFLNGGVQIPSDSTVIECPIHSATGVTVKDNKIIMSSYKEEVILSQPLCSNTINVNSYWVFEEPVKIDAVDQLERLVVHQNSSLTVPTGTTARYSNGTSKIVSIIWTNSVTTDELGTFNMNGTIDGYPTGIRQVIEVVQRPSLDPTIVGVKTPATITIYQYQGLTVPTGVYATYSDGSTKVVPVAWVNTINTATLGNHTLRGVVEGYDPEVLMKVEVIEAPPNSLVNGFMNIAPSVDNWIDTKNVVVNSQQVVSRKDYTSSSSFRRATGYDGRVSTGTSTTTASGSVIEQSVSKDDIVTHARQIEVTVRAKSLPPNTDNLHGYIDGVRVDLTALEGTRKGSLNGTIRANPDGTAVAKFKIPQGIKTGSREVVLANDACTSSAIFSSKGILRTITTTRIQPVTVHTYIDPLAQTFTVPESRFITSFNLYFATKDAKQPVIIQLRNVVNGYPGMGVYSRVDLTPDQISVSEDGSIATKVTLPVPVHCEANELYAICILTESLEYNMHIATLNDPIPGTDDYVRKQPYTEGVLFNSSNAVTWTALQTSDLKFEVFGAVFDKEGTITFRNREGLTVDDLLLMADQYAVPGASITWEYKTNIDTWQPIENYINRELPYSASTLQLRAKIVSTRNLSPTIDWESISFIGYSQQLTGCYIHRRVTTSQAYKKVKIVVEHNTPSDSSITPRITFDDENWHMVTNVGSQNLGQGWYRTTYTYDIPDTGSDTRYRTRLDLETTSRNIRPKARKLMVILS